MTRFSDLLNRTMNCAGIKQEDFDIMLRNNKVLTDEIIFAITSFIDSQKNTNIFFTKKIGDTEIRVRFFDIAVDYVIYNSKQQISAVVSLNLNTLTLIVEYPLIKEKYTIQNDLLDFEREKRNKLSILRMQVLNELLTRYYSIILYNLYRVKRR